MIASTTPTALIGCDVGKASIVVFDSRDGRLRTIPNRRDALLAFLDTLDAQCLIVCEATGGYEDALLAAALAAGCPAHRADARKVKAFIRMLGTLGKSDGIDARALALYGEHRHAHLSRWQAPDPYRERLQALVLTRRDLVAQRLACANRLGAPGGEHAAAYLTPLLASFDAQIHAIDADVDAIIRSNDDLRRAAGTLRSIAGVGPRTAAALLALIPPPATPPSSARCGPWPAPPELGRLNRREAAALAGLAPHPNQSGQRDGYRRVKGGRPEVKRVLFMAALSAARHNTTLSAAYKALIANGKKPLVALTAVMRRLIVIANAKIRDNIAHLPNQAAI